MDYRITRLSPQGRRLLTMLQRQGSVTQREALMDESIQSLTKRIWELRHHGIAIRTQYKRNPITGQRYARYHLTESLKERV